jgi:hypothetical protein
MDDEFLDMDEEDFFELQYALALSMSEEQVCSIVLA